MCFGANYFKNTYFRFTNSKIHPCGYRQVFVSAKSLCNEDNFGTLETQNSLNYAVSTLEITKKITSKQNSFTIIDSDVVLDGWNITCSVSDASICDIVFFDFEGSSGSVLRVRELSYVKTLNP